METIKSIKEVDWKESERDYMEYSGFIIKTDRQEIKIGISNCQSCCESWGYFISEDEIQDYIGAELIDIVLADTELKSSVFNKEMEDIYMEECSIMFVNFNTNKGMFQFTAYNSHNGYYGHTAVIISNQLNEEEDL